MNKNVENLNTIINQLDIIDIYRTLHSTKAKYTCFSSVHEKFTTVELKHKLVNRKYVKYLQIFGNEMTLQNNPQNNEGLPPKNIRKF